MSTLDLDAEARTVVAELTEGNDLHVATDPRNVRVPGALLALREIAYPGLDDTPTITWDLVLIGTTGSRGLALASLGDMAAQLSPFVHRGVFTARTIRDPNVSPDPVPALVATVITE